MQMPVNNWGFDEKDLLTNDRPKVHVCVSLLNAGWGLNLADLVSRLSCNTIAIVQVLKIPCYFEFTSVEELGCSLWCLSVYYSNFPSTSDVLLQIHKHRGVRFQFFVLSLWSGKTTCFRWEQLVGIMSVYVVSWRSWLLSSAVMKFNLTAKARFPGPSDPLLWSRRFSPLMWRLRTSFVN